MSVSFTGPVRRLARPVSAPAAALEREVAEALLAPRNAVLQALDETAGAMRAQSHAFEAAAVAFHQTADLLAVQAAALEKAADSLRDPAGALRAAGGTLVSHRPHLS
jgi:hypothetical protein